MIKDELLTAYWISIPDEPGFSFGFGVTAFTVEDAFNLLAERGCDFHVCASRADVCEIQDVAAIEYEHIRVNMGLILFRRSWYPCFNVGIDASGRLKRKVIFHTTFNTVWPLNCGIYATNTVLLHSTRAFVV